MKRNKVFMLAGGVAGAFAAYLSVGFVMWDWDLATWGAPDQGGPGARLGMLLMCLLTVPAGMWIGHEIGDD